MELFDTLEGLAGENVTFRMKLGRIEGIAAVPSLPPPDPQEITDQDIPF
jgi:hypothetical protein